MTSPHDGPDHLGQQPAPPATDPWKSFRGVMAGTLIMEAIVVLLALPVVGAVGGGLTALSLTYLLGLAAVLILLVGLQGRSWAIWANLAIQAVAIAGFALYPGLGVIGALFAVVWGLIAYLRAEVRWRQRRGLLPASGWRPHEPAGPQPQPEPEPRPQRGGGPAARGQHRPPD